ncbi:hypothetical protein M1N80_02650 [Peptococcaceae bacterium]|nr:hypothetical protein [Peptococcaceae bacterium]
MGKKIRENVLKVHGIPVETIVFIPPMRVPRTTSGKIQRNKAKLMYLNCEWDNVLGISSMEKFRNDFIVSGKKMLAKNLLQILLLVLLHSNLPFLRINRFFHFEDVKRVLVADILVKYGIYKNTKIGIKNMSFVENNYGKPFLKNTNDLYFNVSHSGEWVVCAIHHHPIGIDIEQVKKIEIDIAKRFFKKGI